MAVLEWLQTISTHHPIRDSFKGMCVKGRVCVPRRVLFGHHPNYVSYHKTVTNFFVSQIKLMNTDN